MRCVVQNSWNMLIPDYDLTMNIRMSSNTGYYNTLDLESKQIMTIK